MHDDGSDQTPAPMATIPDEEDGEGSLVPGQVRPHFIRATVDAISARLRIGGAICVTVRGTFPQQFICAGTSDQIERLLNGPGR